VLLLPLAAARHCHLTAGEQEIRQQKTDLLPRQLLLLVPLLSHLLLTLLLREQQRGR
jgi:hypothetical protein